MTAMAPQTRRAEDAVAQLVADHEAFAANGAAGAPPWVQELRAGAIRQFAEAGFPTTKDEEWRFTSVEPITRTRFAVASATVSAAVRRAVDEVAVGEPGTRLVAVYVNGRFVPELSSLALPAGVTVGSLATAAAGDQVHQHLGQIADSRANPFTALNTAFVQDGAFVHVARNVAVDRPIQLVFVSFGGPEPTVSHPRNFYRFDDGAQASVIEQFVGVGDGPYWTNAVTETVLGENAVVDAYRVQRECDNAFHTATSQSRQGRSSVYTSVTFAFGSRLTRYDLNATLDGEGAECTINGLSVLRDEQHVDFHTTLEHAKPHCPSWEVFNGVYDDRSRGVFSGRIIVRPGAQRTDSKQTNNNLLLSEDARADSQPQLEIYADDVKCTHGATLGPIDPKAMFYLRSRGLDEEAARNLLTFGFGAEILNSVSVEELRTQLDGIVHARLDESARKRSS